MCMKCIAYVLLLYNQCIEVYALHLINLQHDTMILLLNRLMFSLHIGRISGPMFYTTYLYM